MAILFEDSICSFCGKRLFEPSIDTEIFALRAYGQLYSSSNKQADGTPEDLFIHIEKGELPKDIFGMSEEGALYPLFYHLNDSAVHQSCIDKWEHADAFIKLFNESDYGRTLYRNDNGHVLYRSTLSDRPYHQTEPFENVLFTVGSFAEENPATACMLIACVILSLLLLFLVI